MILEKLNIKNVRLQPNNRNNIIFEINNFTYRMTFCKDKKNRIIPNGLFHEEIDKKCPYCKNTKHSISSNICSDMPVKIDDLFQELKEQENVRLSVLLVVEK